jgi:3',5'-cyclic-AMP phosphodiesterase
MNMGSVAARRSPPSTSRIRSVWLWLLLATSSSCLSPAEERADRDERMGQAAVDGAAIGIAEGHGAIVSFARGSAEVWGGAPMLDVALDGGAGPPDRWRVKIGNVLPDARVTATTTADDGTAADLPVSLLSSDFPTEREIEVKSAGKRLVTLHVAPPDEASAAPFRVLIFGDVQEAIDKVQDIYQRMNGEAEARFVVMVGDLTERGTEDELVRFKREMKSLRLPIFTTLGNHELGTDDGAPYSRHFGRGSDSFVFHGARFTMIDSASATLDPKVYGWLDGWLAAGRGTTHIVGMHIPPQDPIGTRNGAFASSAEANLLLSKLGKAHVTATFYGHIHSYYAYENAGIPAIITGGGGAIPERMDTIGRHYMAVDVDPANRRVESALIPVDHD